MKNFKNYLPILALAISSHLVQAQASVSGPAAGNLGIVVAKGNGSISGTVVDADNQQPVGFATITLTDPLTGKALDGTLCDDKGKFTISNIGAGVYKVDISFIGYQTQSLDNVRLANNNTDLNLGAIKISASAQALKEVRVEGQRAMIEEKVDRTVYNAENDASNRGGDASDVLRKVPMLSVDLDGNVSLRGSQNIRVLINNRPSTITAGSVADALKQIPADMIKSVEVITSPSAKYDAEGTGGIINIVTKKNTLQGGSLNIDTGVGLRGANLGLNGAYRVGKMGFSLGGFGRAGYNTHGSFENRQTTKINGVPFQTTLQNADTETNMMFGRYTFGWDYDINDKNYISSSIQYGLRNFNMQQDNLSSLRYNAENALTESSFRDVNSKNQGNNIDVNLNYTHLFAKPQQEFSILTQFSRNNQQSDFINNILNGDGGTVNSRLKNINDSYNQESTIQLDYQNPIAKNQMLELGGKQIMRNVISDYQYFSATGASGPFNLINTQNLNNVFNYNQNISAGYFSYTYTTPSMYTLKAGARYEYTTINADFENSSDQVNIPAYGSFVPSINLSKKLKDGNMIKLAYNRRIQRPSLQFLNPNIQAANPLNITQGNPELNPEFTNNFEIGYNTYVNSTSFNLSAFVRNTNNSIQSVRDFIGDTIRTTFQNIGQEDAYGASLHSNVNISGKLTMNGGVDMYYAVLDNNVPDPNYNASNRGMVFNIRGMANYNLGSGWGLQGFGFYRARQVQLQGHQTGFGIYSLNLKKDFNERKGSIGFGAENFLSSSITQRTNLESPLFDQQSKNIMYNMNFKINFSYRIGKMTAGATKRRTKSVSNDDLKGGGDGGGQDGGTPQQGGGAPGGAPVQGARPGQAPAQGGGAGQFQRPAGAPAGVVPGQMPTGAPAGAGVQSPVSEAVTNQPTQVQDSTQAATQNLSTTLTGKWQGKMGQYDLSLNLIVNGEDLTGTVTTPGGDIAITEGKIAGNAFNFNISYDGNSIPNKGTVNGDTINLTSTYQGQEITGTLNRVK